MSPDYQAPGIGFGAGLESRTVRLRLPRMTGKTPRQPSHRKRPDSQRTGNQTKPRPPSAGGRTPATEPPERCEEPTPRQLIAARFAANGHVIRRDFALRVSISIEQPSPGHAAAGRHPVRLSKRSTVHTSRSASTPSAATTQAARERGQGHDLDLASGRADLSLDSPHIRSAVT